MLRLKESAEKHRTQGAPPVSIQVIGMFENAVWVCLEIGYIPNEIAI